MSAARKQLVLSLSCLFFACMLELAMAAEEQAKDASHSIVLGSGHGIDHIGIAVRDLETAKKTYRDVLGFAVFAGGKHLNGTRNGGPALESGYLELITFWDRTKTEGGVVAKFLEKHEGPFFLGLDVSPVDDTAKLLRTRGFDIQGPESGSINVDPDQHEQPDQPDQPLGSWRPVGLQSGPVPAAHLPAKSADAIFFIQYQPTVHPNTAKKLSSVWMGVRNLEASEKEYESMGFRAARNLAAPQLGARGQEIEAGQGTILLLQPQESAGKVASFLAERGAEGIMGVSIEVASLQTARSLLETNTKRQFEPYVGPYGQSILIPPELTHGVWIEFFQK
jgi:catechol 2,3-dioxygenase-like lactoylglutathione lyase family enzyme